MRNVLLVEGAEEVSESRADLLRYRGHNVTLCKTMESAKKAVESIRFDKIVYVLNTYVDYSEIGEISNLQKKQPGSDMLVVASPYSFGVIENENPGLNFKRINLGIETTKNILLALG